MQPPSVLLMTGPEKDKRKQEGTSALVQLTEVVMILKCGLWESLYIRVKYKMLK